MASTAVEQILGALGVSSAAVSLLACADDRMAVLNADFRGKPAPTNVLSWPETDLAPSTDGDSPHPPQPDPDGTTSLGDIAISYDTCAQEAMEQNKPMAHHVTHMIVHGVLHLLGYDHVRDRDATRMEALEVKLLGNLGVPDPY
ncbi:MAG: rRNA maturation RNase YbeY [Pseudomonadota bacterium]